MMPADTSVPTVDSSALVHGAPAICTNRHSAKNAVSRLTGFIPLPSRLPRDRSPLFPSYPKPALALLKASNGPEEVDLSEDRPIGVTKVILAVRALPEQEPAQPNLTAGSDDEIRIGQIVCIEILADLVDGDLINDILQRDPSRGFVPEHEIGRASCRER